MQVVEKLEDIVRVVFLPMVRRTDRLEAHSQTRV